MSRVIIEVPDMGEVDDVEVVELLVAPGERVDKDQSLLVLESDKASVEIPSTMAGLVHSVIVSMGDRVVTGAPLLRLKPSRRGCRPNGVNCRGRRWASR